MRKLGDIVAQNEYHLKSPIISTKYSILDIRMVHKIVIININPV